MSYLKVPKKLQAFCEELNRRRSEIDPSDIAAVYDLSFRRTSNSSPSILGLTATAEHADC